jgi:hypothetical protein
MVLQSKLWNLSLSLYSGKLECVIKYE